MLHKRTLTGVVEVDGVKYEWQLQREPQWCGVDGYRGMTVLLRLIDTPREAVLEFPNQRLSINRLSNRHRPQINNAIAANGVRAALSAGWDPASRGKPIVYIVDANGC
jgi:hypothetical protein